MLGGFSWLGDWFIQGFYYGFNECDFIKAITEKVILQFKHHIIIGVHNLALKWELRGEFYGKRWFGHHVANLALFCFAVKLIHVNLKLLLFFHDFIQ